MLYSKPTNWTQEQWSSAVKRICKLSERKKSHWDAYYYNNKYDSYVNIPVILISTFISAAAVSQSSAEEGEQSQVTYYIITGLGITNTILTSINKYFGFGENKESHRHTAFNYLELRCELVEMVERRDISGNCSISYEDFNECYYKKMTNVRENAPILPTHLKKTMDIQENIKFKSFLEKVNSEEPTSQNTEEDALINIPTVSNNSLV